MSRFHFTAGGSGQAYNLVGILGDAEAAPEGLVGRKEWCPPGRDLTPQRKNDFFEIALF